MKSHKAISHYLYSDSSYSKRIGRIQITAGLINPTYNLILYSRPLPQFKTKNLKTLFDSLIDLFDDDIYYEDLQTEIPNWK